MTYISDKDTPPSACVACYRYNIAQNLLQHIFFVLWHLCFICDIYSLFSVAQEAAPSLKTTAAPSPPSISPPPLPTPKDTLPPVAQTPQTPSGPDLVPELMQKPKTGMAAMLGLKGLAP